MCGEFANIYMFFLSFFFQVLTFAEIPWKSFEYEAGFSSHLQRDQKTVYAIKMTQLIAILTKISKIVEFHWQNLHVQKGAGLQNWTSMTTAFCGFDKEVEKAMIRNRHNQIPYPALDTKWEKNTHNLDGIK